MNRFMIFFSLPVCIFVSSCHPKIERKPNIIFILADDMGYGDVHCLNPDAKVSTPNLDNLAHQGIIFTDAHSGASVCTPTRYGILTGRYCWRSPLKKSVLWAWDGPLIEEERFTVGDFLKQNGYTTACIGKWHLGWDWPTTDGTQMNDYCMQGDHDRQSRIEFGKKVDLTRTLGNGPVTRGFDYYFGVDLPNFPPYCWIVNDRAQTIPARSKPDSIFGFPGPMTEGWELEEVLPVITQKAIEYIEAGAGEGVFKKEKDKPFFLYFALTAPHTPIAPVQRFQGTSGAGLYGDFVQEVDWVVGEIMKALNEKNLAENTLLIFASDNGSPGRDGANMSGELQSVTEYGHHPSYVFRGMKADIWEGGHRVPFIARWPGEIRPGSRSDELICLTDFMATCSAILGEELPADAAEDSYSILSALTGNKDTQPVRESIVHHSIDGIFAIRQGRWKLVLNGGSGGWSDPRNNQDATEMGLPAIQLYDLENDITEEHNLQEKNPGMVGELTDLLDRYKRTGRSAPVRNME